MLRKIHTRKALRIGGMSPKRKILTLLSVLAAFSLLSVGLNERTRRTREFISTISTFSGMVISTDKALIEFSEIDERYLKGEETKENYEKAWYDLNFKLEQVKKQDDALGAPPNELKELVSLYRAGFYRVLSVTNDVVDYLGGTTEDPVIIIKDREKFVEGLRLLKETRERLESSVEGVI